MQRMFHPYSPLSCDAETLLNLLRAGARRQSSLLTFLDADLTGAANARRELLAHGYKVQIQERGGEIWWHLDRSES